MKIEDFKSRIKENFKKNKVFLVLFTIIWISLIVISINHYSNVIGKESIGTNYLEEVVEITNNNSLEQIIDLEKDAESIAIKYAGYARKNKGTMNILVTGIDSKTVYLNENVSINKLQDNAFVAYTPSKPFDVNTDRKISIKISSNSEKGSSVGVYVTNIKYFADSLMKVNEKETEQELGLHFLVNNEEYYDFSKIVILWTIVIYSIIIAIILLISPKLEVIFTTLVLTTGIIFVVIMSMGGLPDEVLHYENVLQVSNGILGQDKSSIDKYYVNYDSFSDHDNSSYTYHRLIRDFDKEVKLTGKYVEFNSKVEGQYTGYYAPQVIGVTLGRLLNLNMIKIFMLGRVINLLFYSLCVYIAIKNTPTRKMLFGLISILPIFIQQASSYSYDASVNGLILISISFLLKWLSSDEAISKKDIAIVFVTSLLLAPAKVVYGLFTLMYWFVPSSKFNGKKNKVAILLLLSSPTIYYILYNVYIRVEGTFSLFFEENSVYTLSLKDVPISYDDGEMPTGKLFNMVYIFENPLKTIEIIYRSVRFYLSTWFYQSLGRSLAGNSLVIPMTCVRVSLICLLMTSIRVNEYNPSIGVKIAFVGACVIVALFIVITMLTGWTTRTDVLIKGVQGRYFCPLLPYFFSIFTNKYIKVTDQLDKPIIFTTICNLFFTILYILAYTFIH